MLGIIIILNYFISHPKEFQFLEQFYFSPLIDLKARQQGALYFAELTKVYEEGQNQEILKKGGKKGKREVVWHLLYITIV